MCTHSKSLQVKSFHNNKGDEAYDDN